MSKYTFKTRFIFSGDVTVKANSEQEAREIAKYNLWARDAKVADNDEDKIVDWGIDYTSDETEILEKIKS